MKEKIKTVTFPMPADLHAEAKAAAATARIPLKAWFFQAIQEKLDRAKGEKS